MLRPRCGRSEKTAVKVYFRTADVYKNVTVNVTDGKNILFSVKKKRMAPGEMESITIKPELLENTDVLSFELTENTQEATI